MNRLSLFLTAAGYDQTGYAPRTHVPADAENRARERLQEEETRRIRAEQCERARG